MARDAGAVRSAAAHCCPNTAVVCAGTTGNVCCPLVDRTCGHINFFTDPDAARAWVTRHPDITGVVLNQEAAIASAVAEFLPSGSMPARTSSMPSRAAMFAAARGLSPSAK